MNCKNVLSHCASASTKKRRQISDEGEMPCLFKQGGAVWDICASPPPPPPPPHLSVLRRWKLVTDVSISITNTNDPLSIIIKRHLQWIVSQGLTRDNNLNRKGGRGRRRRRRAPAVSEWVSVFVAFEQRDAIEWVATWGSGEPRRGNRPLVARQPSVLRESQCLQYRVATAAVRLRAFSARQF